MPIFMGLLIWESIVKTTIEINDDLFQRIKNLAHERDATLKSIIEFALRRVLSEQPESGKKPFHLRKRSFNGKGIHPGIKEGDWSDIRKRAYEGRGG